MIFYLEKIDFESKLRPLKFPRKKTPLIIDEGTNNFSKTLIETKAGFRLGLVGDVVRGEKNFSVSSSIRNANKRFQWLIDDELHKHYFVDDIFNLLIFFSLLSPALFIHPIDSLLVVAKTDENFHHLKRFNLRSLHIKMIAKIFFLVNR